MGFTSGPWLVRYPVGAHQLQRAIYGPKTGWGKGDAVIAHTHGARPEAENVANAALIAAAPALYEYLEIALGVIEKSKIVWMGADGARAALSLAREGRQP